MNQAGRTLREKALLALCLLVVVVGLWIMLTSSGAGGRKLLPAAQARQKYEAAVKQRQAMREEMDRLQPELEKRVYTETPEQLIPKAIRTLQGYAKDSGIHLREIKPLRARRIAAVTKVPVSVRFTAEFQKSLPFLYHIEDPKGKFVVEKFNVSAADPKSKLVDIEAQVALFTRGGGTEL